MNIKFHRLTGSGKGKMHHRAKFRQNPSIRCGDITILRFFKMAAAAIFDFINSQFLLADAVWRVEMHHCAKLRQNWSNGF